MDYIVREIKIEEYSLLNNFLYEAIYIPVGVTPPPKSIINDLALQKYIFEFGRSKHDFAIVAEVEGNIVGIAWARIMDDYGHINKDTPSLAMSIYREYRGVGIGTALLKKLLTTLKAAGYPSVSLSVQKENYAVKMYQKVGFIILKEKEEEYIMVINF